MATGKDGCVRRKMRVRGTLGPKRNSYHLRTTEGSTQEHASFSKMAHRIVPSLSFTAEIAIAGTPRISAIDSIEASSLLILLVACRGSSSIQQSLMKASTRTQSHLIQDVKIIESLLDKRISDSFFLSASVKADIKKQER